MATLDPGFLVIRDGYITTFADLAARAAELLGIDDRLEANQLFYGEWSRHMQQITPEEVILPCTGCSNRSNHPPKHLKSRTKQKNCCQG